MCRKKVKRMTPKHLRSSSSYLSSEITPLVARHFQVLLEHQAQVWGKLGNFRNTSWFRGDGHVSAYFSQPDGCIEVVHDATRAIHVPSRECLGLTWT